MGIKHLAQLIAENAPDAIKTGEIKNQFGRKVAIVSFSSLTGNSRTLTRKGCVRIPPNDILRV
jgi:hypothetical protein